MKNYQYEQEQLESFGAVFDNEEEMFDFEKGEGILERTAPKKSTTDNDIASPCGVVTESSETIIWDGNVEKVRRRKKGRKESKLHMNNANPYGWL
jgi:hypothetical protein